VKQIVVISGKGGTGKTILTASFAALAQNKVMVDCDVDAADLHLLLQPEIKERHEFRSGMTARINAEICEQCGQCISVCRFDAISKDFIVDPVSCEGCTICSYVCPAGAITLEENISGEWFISNTKYGPLVHAKLGIAEENSGKLVMQVRQAAKEIAEKDNLDYVIIDGPPGIGCPVIASLSGVDLAVIVTEPTL
jgi:MinD superfamily P-loop ATPase